MKKLQLLWSIVFFTLTASAQKIIKSEQVTNHSIHVTGDNFDGVIFSKDYTSPDVLLLRQKGRVYANDSTIIQGKYLDKYVRFTPTNDDIEKAETILRANIKHIYKKLPSAKFVRGPGVYSHLNKYTRQYFGFSSAGNVKIIFINCFWDTRETGADDYVKVYDGGNYYWTIKVNISNGQLFDFGVNGAI